MRHLLLVYGGTKAYAERTLLRERQLPGKATPTISGSSTASELQKTPPFRERKSRFRAA